MRARMPDIALWKLAALAVATAVATAGIAALALGLGADEEGAPAQPAGAVDLRELPAGTTGAGAAKRAGAGASAGAAALVPGAGRRVRALARRMPLERRVAQLFLLGFPGQDATAPVFERVREPGVGGLVLDAVNYSYPDQLAALAGGLVAVAAEAGHVRPWLLAPQEGGELNAFPDLPPATAAADVASGAQAFEESRAAAEALGALGIDGVLAPVADVAPPDGIALGARAYSGEPREVATYATAVIDAYARAGMLTAAAHFPGLGAGGEDPRLGPSQVPGGLEDLRRRDLVPFRAAIRAGVPAIAIGNGLYVTDDFVTPGSLSRAIATTLLRHELGFDGLAIAANLAQPSVTALTPIPDAAVAAVRAGADLLHISGPPEAQVAAYDAVLAAVRDRRIPRSRLDEALLRNLVAKRDHGLLE